MSNILSLDPGGTTGWALSNFTDTEPLVFIDGGQVEGALDGFVEWFPNHIKEILPNSEQLFIVSESFTLRPGVKSPDVTPLRIEGALTAFVGPGVVRYQQPAIKALVPDSKLREHGLWIPGQRHQMDARIHALAYAAKQYYHVPTLRKYWGADG